MYVNDLGLETGLRFSSMIIPANMIGPQKQILESVMVKVQEDLHNFNPYIQDFKQIMEISEEQLGQGRIVISARARPTGQHERRYNEQINLQEVSILTNSQPHNLVLQQRGEGLKSISDLNPKGMPLHFTLLFPHGTYGWNPEERHKYGNRRIISRSPEGVLTYP